MNAIHWPSARRMTLASALAFAFATALDAGEPSPINAEQLAQSVTIYRDPYGVPHVTGPTDASVAFGFAYAQAEDYFWQIEDTYILGLGRYSEVHGARVLNSDFLNRAFEIVPRAKADFSKLDPKTQEICAACAAGLNYYLEKNPQVKPRLIDKFEPWHVTAMIHHLTLELCYRYTRLSHSFAPRDNDTIYTVRASNAWAVAPSRTKSGKAMLFTNPHQPWFGFGQFYEGHLKSGEGWEVYGGSFFGIPLPIIGHNEYMAWTATTNEPDIADAWRETFDDPKNPLNYRYGDGYRTATEWKETISVRTGGAMEKREYVFRKTHHGPVVSKESDTVFLSANIAKLHEANLLGQAMQMLRSKNFKEWHASLDGQNLQYMNLTYADRDGNIFYIYNGIVPRRNPKYDWSQPVDGSDPGTEWNGFHATAEMPQVLNPISGFVQNCNSSPFTTTDDGNPFLLDFPPYMVEDKYDDKRRAKIARKLLREMRDVTFEQMQVYAYDTTMYWPLDILPWYKRDFERLAKEETRLAAQVKPYLDHLFNWDCKVRADSTQATLCAAWYEELYGFGYPAETMRPQYVDNPNERYRALVNAADKLKRIHGDWKVKWGDVHRIQRHADVADFMAIPFSDDQSSLPSEGAPSPLGIIFTQLYTPSIFIPPIKIQRKQFGVVGVTYMSVVEFGDRVKAVSLTQFGQSGDPKSPHYFDQAKLLSEKKLKPVLYYWDEIEANSKMKYSPGGKVIALRP